MKHWRWLRSGLADHPGVPMLAIWSGAGGLMGLQRDVLHGFLCALVMPVIFGPVVLWTAYSEGRRRALANECPNHGRVA